MRSALVKEQRKRELFPTVTKCDKSNGTALADISKDMISVTNEDNGVLTGIKYHGGETTRK